MILLAVTRLSELGLHEPSAALDAPTGVLQLYNGIQGAALLLLALLAACSPRRARWLLCLSGPAMAVVVQALWLARSSSPSSAVLTPDGFPVPSTYAVLEAFKLIWLLMVGFGSDLMTERVAQARVQRSSWTPISPVRPTADRAWPPFPGG
jgi:hypothetical protein